MSPFELTVFGKDRGHLSKSIRLLEDGTVHSDGSQCVMASGWAHRVYAPTVAHLCTLINWIGSEHALALGRMRDGIPDVVKIASREKVDEHPGAITRTIDNFAFTSAPTWGLIDFDSKGMPAEIRTKIEKEGGVWRVLCSLMPALTDAAHVLRRSTSAGLYRTDTCEPIPGSDGLHIYVGVSNGLNIPHFIKTLHERCWLHGFGWHRLSASGALLERSIVDVTVASPERLVFEGKPIVEPPLAQDLEARKPYVDA